MSRQPPRARLAKGNVIRLQSAPDVQAGIAADSAVIKTGHIKPPLWRRASRSLVLTGVIGVVLLVAVYVIIATTVIFVAPTSGNNVLVLRSAYPVGQAPTNAYVYVSDKPNDYSIPGKFSQAFGGISAGSVVRIITGPNGAVATAPDGTITLNGTSTGIKGNADPQTLSKTYVATCVTGHCTPGDTVLVPQTNVVGGVKGYLHLTSVEKLPGTTDPKGTTP